MMKRRPRLVAAIVLAAAAFASGVHSEPVAAGVTVTLPECQAEVDAVIAQHGGMQTSFNEVSWQDGDVVMSLPCGGSAAAAALLAAAGKAGECPSGWYCFFEHINFNKDTPGRRLQFRDCGPFPYGRTQYFYNWGFENQTSSWIVNRNVQYIDVYDWNVYLWTMERGRSSYVGNVYNDRADYFTCVS